MRSKVLDLRPNIFQKAWGFFSLFIIHYFLQIPTFDDILAIYLHIVYVNITADDVLHPYIYIVKEQYTVSKEKQ